MSFVRVTRARSSHSLAKRQPKVKKKAPGKQEWDNSVHDLAVHRASAEDLVRRHEIHRSKNQEMAQWELQKQALKKKWKKENRGAPDPLEKRRLAIMREILFDQYQMNDVLERSDRAMAVVKDLFGDAPRRHTGFPNVTVAPYCDLETSRGPLAQKKDPPTQLSVLSESIMDPQALNEVERSFSHLEHSEDERDVSISFQSDFHTERVHRLLKEEDSRLLSPLWSENKPKAVKHAFVTPCKPAAPSHGQTVLNATTAVKRVKARLQLEETEEPAESSCMIGQVLNPQLKNHRRAISKGKKTSASDIGSCRTEELSLSKASAYDLPSGNQSSLDVLNQMIQDVEREMEAYERQSGRQVTVAPQGQGVSGFTLSLLSSLKRLVRYIKESDMQLREETLQRQRLQAELSEQRVLIDALTADILSFKDRNAIPRCDLQPRAAATGKQLASLPEARRSLPEADPERLLTPARSGNEGVLQNPDLQIEDLEGEQECFEASPEKLRTPTYRRTTEEAQVRSRLPSHVFQPAVMLSPPRQKTRKEFCNQSEVLKRTIATISSYPTNMPSNTVEKKVYPETKFSNVSVKSQSSPEDSCNHAQRWRMPQGLEGSSKASTFISCPQSYYPSQGDAQVTQHLPEPVEQNIQERRLAMEEGQGAYTQNIDLMARMTELTRDNAASKTPLRKIGCSTRSLETLEGGTSSTKCAENAKSTETWSERQNSAGGIAQMSLEHRIAELNRQSSEARNKLLNLIEHQKQSTVISPAISPITPQNERTGTGGRLIEVSLSMPRLPDSSLEESPSPASRTGGRRSSGVSNRTGSSVNSSGGGRRAAFGHCPKVGKEREEGWFALSAHVS